MNNDKYIDCYITHPHYPNTSGKVNLNHVILAIPTNDPDTIELILSLNETPWYFFTATKEYYAAIEKNT